MWPPPKISHGTSLANDESRDFALQYTETTFTLINFHCRAENRNGPRTIFRERVCTVQLLMARRRRATIS